MQTMPSLPAQRHWSCDKAPDATDRNDLRARAELLAEVLDEIDTGVLVCDELATIQAANWSARRELSAGRLLRTCAESLRSSSCEADLHAAIGAACKNGRRAVLALAHGDQRLLVSVSPLRAGSNESLALVMLGRRDPCSRVALELLGMEQGLTSSERRVLAGLAAQRSPAQIASDHCVAISTVRTQIAALRAKLGAKSQHALVCLVYGIPPLAAALRLTAAAPAPLPNSPIERMHFAA